MAMQIDCYLSFAGNCEEALNFYAQCLGGKVTTLMRWGGSPMDQGKLPAAWKDKVMHATLQAEDAQIMGSDLPPGYAHAGYHGITVSLYVKNDVEKARKAFEALSAGGEVTMPFAPPFWGGHFGMLKDRFGVPWMISTE